MDNVSWILPPRCANQVIFSSVELSILSFFLLVGAYLCEEVPLKQEHRVLYPAHVCACAPVCVWSPSCNTRARLAYLKGPRLRLKACVEAALIGGNVLDKWFEDILLHPFGAARQVMLQASVRARVRRPQPSPPLPSPTRPHRRAFDVEQHWSAIEWRLQMQREWDPTCCSSLPFSATSEDADI